MKEHDKATTTGFVIGHRDGDGSRASDGVDFMSDIIERINSKFRSGNSIPVRQAMIKREEWEEVRELGDKLERTERENERLREVFARGFFGVSDEADFSAGTWQFCMEDGYRVGAGRYLIIPESALSGEEKNDG
ncbi:MAG TPA: hypothetical protein VK973_10540 [Arenicellales bacterium]|nr:hypothetical protein [Arenicellales bacterium]